MRVHINLIGLIWRNGSAFRRFDHWLKTDVYCATVDVALSKDMEASNDFSYASGAVKRHQSVQFRGRCEQYDIELCNWPGYSTDFNAIELVWNIIKQEVKNKNLKSQSELKNAMDEA